MLFMRRDACRRPSLGEKRWIGGAARCPRDERPTRFVVELEQLWIVPAGRRVACIWQKHDWLEALSGMDSHHPHCLARCFHVALDRNVGGLEIRQESRQRRRPLAIMRERQP